jgi:DNA-binding transcriptional ArsR family regulator
MQGVEHKPTDEKRKLVQTLAAVGITYEDIASKLDISADTLTKHYKAELINGRVDANANIGQKLYQQANGGNTQAQIFWLKTRAGWSETNKHEITGASGIPLSVAVEFVNAEPRDEEVSE